MKSEVISAPLDACALKGDAENWTSRRRSFVGMLGAGMGLAALGQLSGCGGGGGGGVAHAATLPTEADTLRMQLLQDSDFWTQVQNMFTLDAGTVWTGTGTAGSMPRVVLDLFDAENRKQAAVSGAGYTDLLELRKQIAPGFGVDPDEVAFTGGATSGLAHTILGLDWRRGDVVVTTNHEYRSGYNLLRVAEDRYGIEVSRVRLPVGNKQTADMYAPLFDEHIRSLKAQGKRVRAMLWSSPTQATGTVLPIDELMKVVKAHELISIVDGAHRAGLFADNYSELGVDFMAASGHKWQCGPGSTGILIVRNKMRASNPLPLPKWYPVHSYNYHSEPRTTNGKESFDIASDMTACGNIHPPLFMALARSCELWDSIGRKKIETYDITLSSYLKERIVERWGIDSLYSPKDDPRLRSGITAFMPFQNKNDVHDADKCTRFRSRLQTEYHPGFQTWGGGIEVIGDPRAHQVVRLQTHLWLDPSDIDTAVDAMWDLSRKMA
jgi:isopenicillin-N epimerase